MYMMSGGVILRGAVNEDGSVNSFYMNNEQRNLLGFFFCLLGKTGSRW